MIDASRAAATRQMWGLPKILSVASQQVRYQPPRRYYRGSEPAEATHGVEILVRTSAELPSRGQAPTLFVGDVPLYEYEPVGRNTYRFFVYRVEKLKEGAPISLGWPQFKDRKVSTKFRFNPAPVR